MAITKRIRDYIKGDIGGGFTVLMPPESFLPKVNGDPSSGFDLV